MAKTATYSKIASTTLGSAASVITFSSIDAGYTDLVLVVTPIVTSATTFGIRYNNVSTGTPYSMTQMEGNGTTTASTRLASQNEIRVSYSSTSRTTNSTIITVNILDYSNTTTFKTNISRAGAASDGVDAIVGLWRSTAAINRIDFLPMSGGTIINTGTVATLYGIQAVN
jgi:hypothetical protein